MLLPSNGRLHKRRLLNILWLLPPIFLANLEFSSLKSNPHRIHTNFFYHRRICQFSIMLNYPESMILEYFAKSSRTSSQGLIWPKIQEPLTSHWACWYPIILSILINIYLSVNMILLVKHSKPVKLKYYNGL